MPKTKATGYYYGSTSRTAREKQREIGGADWSRQMAAANAEVFDIPVVKTGRHRSSAASEYKEFTFQRTPGRSSVGAGYIRTVVFKGKINADVHSALMFVLREISRDIQTDLKRTVATWNHPVNFYIRSRKEGKNTIIGRTFYDRIDSVTYAEVVYGTKDPVWHYLESGTDIRHVGVTPDWISKTVPSNFDSNPGRGSVAGFYAPENAVEGIQARSWFKMLQDKYENRFVTQIKYNYRMAMKGR